MWDFVFCLCKYAQQRRRTPELYFGVKLDLRRLFGYLLLRLPFVTAYEGKTYTLRELRIFFVLMQTKTELIPYNCVFAFSSEDKTMPIFRPLLDERLSSCSDENFGSAEKVSPYELSNSVASHRVRSYISRCASGIRLRQTYMLIDSTRSTWDPTVECLTCRKTSVLYCFAAYGYWNGPRPFYFLRVKQHTTSKSMDGRVH